MMRKTLASILKPSCRSVLFTLCISQSACAQMPRNADTSSFDPALVSEQHRRIAMFDSVVRSIDTNSAYKLWHWTVMLSDAKVGQQVECEYDCLFFRYGTAAYYAIRRMEDTVWRDGDPAQRSRTRSGLRGESLPVNEKVCGRPPGQRAPYWLREWFIYPLPQLPPSPTDSAPRLRYEWR